MARRLYSFALIGLLFASVHPGHATETGATAHSGHGVAVDQSLPASTQAFMEANDVMHRDMAITYTGNADVDFLLGMIPHHQGAVDMARIVLEHGTDPEVRKLAEAVIAAQTVEIEWMQERLRVLGH
ncbi:DUF305 domain-containing protein [uncultured Marivita sp.]|uniref:CopM family metallochaperone n=1 Tax=uncultured Marivita sp. TaxID=888080 RepID=UPI002611EFEC|nr:DUF305 domain-containing protein [uncultured Marivita sp.]